MRAASVARGEEPARARKGRAAPFRLKWRDRIANENDATGGGLDRFGAPTEVDERAKVRKADERVSQRERTLSGMLSRPGVVDRHYNPVLANLSSGAEAPGLVRRSRPPPTLSP